MGRAKQSTAELVLAQITKSNPFDRWAEVESRANNHLISPCGKRRGQWQMCERNWEFVNSARKRFGQVRYPFHQANVEKIARWYAAQFVGLVIVKFKKATGRSPDWCDLYIMHRIGFSEFRSYNFQIMKAPDEMVLIGRYIQHGKVDR